LSIRTWFRRNRLRFSQPVEKPRPDQRAEKADDDENNQKFEEREPPPHASIGDPPPGDIGSRRRNRPSKGNIVDACNRGEQSDYDNADHTPMTRIDKGSSTAIIRLMRSRPLLGQRRRGLQHLGQTSRALSNPDQVHQRFVEQPVISRASRVCCRSNAAFEPGREHLKTVQPQRFFRDFRLCTSESGLQQDREHGCPPSLSLDDEFSPIPASLATSSRNRL